MVGKSYRAIRFLVGLILSFLLIVLPLNGSARDIPTETAMPLTTLESEGQFVRVPDWSQISFSSLPPILSDGSFTAPAFGLRSFPQLAGRRSG
jgi:hypothetical protein